MIIPSSSVFTTAYPNMCQIQVTGSSICPAATQCPPTSCQVVINTTPSAPSARYFIYYGGQLNAVYCYMVGATGWALLMKIDGTTQTFAYTSALWTNTNSFNPSAVGSGLDNTEFKSPLFSTLSFTQILLGMKVPTSSSSCWISASPSRSTPKP